MNLCVIFDLDGTLVDSESLCNQAFLDLVPEIPDNIDELVRRYRGARFATILTELATRHGIAFPTDFESHYRTRVACLFETNLKPMPGALEMLKELAYPRCIASGGPLAKIRHSLEISGLAPFFNDRLYSSYEVGSWKPEPGLFLHAAEKMGYPPAQCVVVEDSDLGVAAATRAGMRAVRFSQDATEQLRSQTPTIDDLRTLPRALAGFQTVASGPPFVPAR
ncbi:MAG: HAD-IA family hydrolase [Steroidobacteraceae bacterium]